MQHRSLRRVELLDTADSALLTIKVVPKGAECLPTKDASRLTVPAPSTPPSARQESSLTKATPPENVDIDQNGTLM
jgi:hypothetical protein